MDVCATLPTRFFSDIQAKGFAHLDLDLSQLDSLRLYCCFDRLCDLLDDGYDEAFALLDGIIDEFISSSKTPLANQTLKMKNITMDSLKYNRRAGGAIDYDIHSCQYLCGLYEHIAQSPAAKNVKPEAMEFLKMMSIAYALIVNQMASMIENITNTVACAPVLKIWKHSPRGSKSFFLPPHCDRSLFTIIINTKNSGDECLRIYSSSQDDSSAYPPSPCDFPLIFPGSHAKTHFNLEPTRHCVLAPRTNGCRYSLVLFLAQYQGW